MNLHLIENIGIFHNLFLLKQKKQQFVFIEKFQGNFSPEIKLLDNV